jgi:hypothetical protein|nr:MAG TPA: shock protein A [Bacteriophage sp.]
MLNKLKAIIAAFFKKKTKDTIFNNADAAKEYIEQRIKEVERSLREIVVEKTSVSAGVQDMQALIEKETKAIEKDESALKASVAQGEELNKSEARRIFMRKGLLAERQKILAEQKARVEEYETLCFDLTAQRERLELKKTEVSLNANLGKSFNIDIDSNEFIREISVNVKGQAEASRILSRREESFSQEGFSDYLKSLEAKSE